MARLLHCEPIGGEHGISCIIPTLDNIIRYEKKELTLDRGYPRFIRHPFVNELAAASGPNTLPVYSTKAARFLRDAFSFLADTEIIEREGYALLKCPDKESFDTLFTDARNCGFTVSSRRGAAAIAGEAVIDNPTATNTVKQKIAQLESGSDPNLIRLFPSGMAAIFTLMTASLNGKRSGITMVGNPYIDTRILMKKIPERLGTTGFKRISIDTPVQEGLSCSTGLLLLELPTNPLVRIADVEAIVAAAHRQGTAVAVDATIATPYNFHPFDWGIDAVVHSSTKFLNGMNNHLGGILLLNPDSHFLDPLLQEIDRFIALTDIAMDPLEAEVLSNNLEGFTDRMRIINKNGPIIAQWLENHPAVDRVWYPGLSSHPDHDKVSKYMPGGTGGLLSFFLKRSCLETASAFYDNCTIAGRGPSLGGEQSLLCPITLLTDFDATDRELDQLGQDRYTMRLSVGTEPVDELKRSLTTGLDRCTHD